MADDPRYSSDAPASIVPAATPFLARFAERTSLSHTLDELCSQLMIALREHGLPDAAFLRYSQDHEALVVDHVRGMDAEFSVGQRVRVPALLERPVRIADGGAVPGTDPPSITPPALTALPVDYDAQPLGLLLVPTSAVSETSAAFSAALRTLLFVFAARYRTILRITDHERLVLAMRAILDLETAISEAFSAAFRHERPDATGLYHALAEKAVELTGATSCDISIVAGDAYAPIAQAGQLAGIGRTARFGDRVAESSISLRAITKKTPCFYCGKRRDEFFMSMVASAQTDEMRTLLLAQRAWGAFPIIVHGASVGAVSVVSSDWDYFTAWRCQVLEMLARKAGLTITMGEVIDQVAQRLRSHSDRLACLTEELRLATRNTSHAEVARMFVHNIANEMTHLLDPLEVIRQRAKRLRDERTSAALVKVERICQDIEGALNSHRRFGTSTTDTSHLDVHSLLKDVLDFARPRASNYNIILELRPEATPAFVCCRANDLMLAFLNLVSNAIDATRDKGAFGRRLLVKVARKNERVVIRFEDEGAGIRNADLKRVWEPNFSRKRATGGSGLGLPFVKAIVEELGGSVSIDSAIGRGTTVILHIPLSEE